MDKEANAVIKIITDKNYRFLKLESKGLYKHANDEEIIKKVYAIKMGKELALDEPHALSEKIQWIKLHDRNRIYYTLLDRYKVKKWVEKKIGSEHVADTYGVWRLVNGIEYFKCPSKFVLKFTHNPDITLCCDKYESNFRDLKKLMRKSYAKNLYWNGNGREWAYQYVGRGVMAEEYIPEIWGKDTIKYSVICFNGEVEFITAYKREADNDNSFKICGHYDKEWKVLPFCINQDYSEGKAPKPQHLDEMIWYVEILSKGMPLVSVEGFYVNNKYVFEGMTPYPYNGFMKFEPDEWDVRLGEKLDLSSFDARIISFPTEKIKDDD